MIRFAIMAALWLVFIVGAWGAYWWWWWPLVALAVGYGAGFVARLLLTRGQHR